MLIELPNAKALAFLKADFQASLANVHLDGNQILDHNRMFGYTEFTLLIQQCCTLQNIVPGLRMPIDITVIGIP